MRRLVIATVLVLLPCSFANATDRYATPANLSSQLAAALPGDRVILAPGNYGHVWLANKNGTAGNLIQIVAQDPANRPVFQISGSEGIQIASCSYLLFDGIVVQGAMEEGIHLQDAGSGPSNHIIMRNVRVTMGSSAGNIDNWKCDYTSDVLFYNCTGNVNGDAAFDMMGVNAQLVMRSTSNGNCFAHAKNGSHNVGYYKNVMNNTGERNFQFGGNGLYNYDQIAMGNVIYGASPQSVVYTTARYDEVRYNTIQNLNPGGLVLRYLNEGAGDPPTAYNTFSNNLVQFVGGTWSAGPYTQPETTTFANNFWSKTPSLPAPETGGVVGNPQLDGEYRPGNPAAKDYGAHAPGMEEAWAAYTGRFAWAWSYASGYDPDADAGGTYTLYKHGGLGGSVVLDATGSYAGNNPNAVSAPGLPALANYHQNVISAYGWDLNGDNVFGDATGATPTLTYAALLGYGRGAVGAYQIELAILVDTDYDDIREWEVTGVTVAEAHVGDLDFDGDVDFQDYQVLEANFGLTGRNWTHGDFNDDGDVDFQDYQALEANFGWVDGQAVPEPTSLALLVLGAFLGRLGSRGVRACPRGRR